MSNAQIDLKKFTDKVKKGLQKTISAKEMQKIAAYVIAEIKERSRRGFGTASATRAGGVEKRFPALTKSYIDRRKRIKLSPFTTPSKSNITRSGRMLASLRYKTKDGAARIEVTGKSREGRDNQDIAGYLADQGRYFMNLTSRQLTGLLKFVDSNIKKIK